MSLDIEDVPHIELHNEGRQSFVPVFDEDDEDEDQELFYCYSCLNVGIESILRKEITYATVDKKGNTILKTGAESILGSKYYEEEEYRQCPRCGGIYALSKLRRLASNDIALAEGEEQGNKYKWGQNYEPKTVKDSLGTKRTLMMKKSLQNKKLKTKMSPNSRTKKPKKAGKLRPIKKTRIIRQGRGHI